MDKRKKNVSKLVSRFRTCIQAGATLLTNIHLPNFFKGGIYQGNGKAVCVPGLNCYSCPAASGACPIGSFQAVFHLTLVQHTSTTMDDHLISGQIQRKFGSACKFKGHVFSGIFAYPARKFDSTDIVTLTMVGAAFTDQNRSEERRVLN